MRRLELPAPFRDPRVLRTLILLDLESHPAPAGIDRVSITIDPTPGRIVQFSLLDRAQPTPEQLSTLCARLTAVLGDGRAGAPGLLDTYRPGAFVLRPFALPSAPPQTAAPAEPTPSLPIVMRRFRLPVPARVVLDHGRPVRVVTGRQGLTGGAVTASAGPWRTSGHWWREEQWNRDEWDVALTDGVYRIFLDRGTDQWFVAGLID